MMLASGVERDDMIAYSDTGDTFTHGFDLRWISIRFRHGL
jgi:hypothetical protein